MRSEFAFTKERGGDHFFIPRQVLVTIMESRRLLSEVLMGSWVTAVPVVLCRGENRKSRTCMVDGLLGLSLLSQV